MCHHNTYVHVHAKKMCGMEEELYECMYEQLLCACVSMGELHLCFDAKW